MSYVPILLLFLVLVGVAATLLLLSRFFGPQRPLAEKATTYECGVDTVIAPTGQGEQVPIKYATVALIFIIFDVEAAFFIPWAVRFRHEIASGNSASAIVFIGIFLLVLLFGLVYCYRRQAFDWD